MTVPPKNGYVTWPKLIVVLVTITTASLGACHFMVSTRLPSNHPEMVESDRFEEFAKRVDEKMGSVITAVEKLDKRNREDHTLIRQEMKR